MQVIVYSFFNPGQIYSLLMVQSLCIMNATHVPESSFTCTAIINVKNGKDGQGYVLHGMFSLSRTHRKGLDGGWGGVVEQYRSRGIVQ